MKIFDLVKKHGIVTRPYPAQPYEVERFFRGKPTYKYENCIGCAACGVACPSNAISVKWSENKASIKWQYDCGRCIFCGRCDEVCPTGAIFLSGDYELAVKFDKTALLQQGELKSVNCEVCAQPFTSQKFVDFCLQNIENSSLSEERKQNAKKYIKICPNCKRNNTIKSMVAKNYEVVK